MSTDFFILMKAELGLVAVLLILLFIKIRDGINTNNSLLRIANAMLAVNCIAGFFSMKADHFSVTCIIPMI
ncbi:MAG: hypothetical protein IPM74_15825 [Crocinitomicaceae bacterium]|nr:hypothetical protein [Crocinitomicaceae bacterium]